MSKAGNNAKQSGKLGEDAVFDVFGMSEPDVEVKTVMKQKPALIEVSQLERFTGKTYVFVVYDRGPRGSKGKKRVFRHTIPEAFANPLKFLFKTSDELIELAKADKFGLRFVKHEYESGGRFYFEFPVEKYLTGVPFRVHNEHRIYNGEWAIEHAKQKEEVPF